MSKCESALYLGHLLDTKDTNNALENMLKRPAIQSFIISCPNLAVVIPQQKIDCLFNIALLCMAHSYGC